MSNLPSNESRGLSTLPKILQYEFIKDVVLPMLDDYDVLARLMIANKAVSLWIRHYVVAATVDYDKAIELLSVKQSVRLTIKSVKLKHVDSLDFTLLPNLDAIFFDSDFDLPIPAGAIPTNGVKSIVFPGFFDQPLVSGAIPNTVQNLWHNGNHPLSLGSIPSSVANLYFGFTFNQPLPAGVIPDGVKDLTFGDDFNQPILLQSLPCTLEKLSFGSLIGSDFNQPLSVGALPDSLLYLRFNGHYKHAFELGSLPHSLTELDLKYDCITLPVGVLPSSLNKFYFDCTSDMNLNPLEPGVFPHGLTHLQLCGSFNSPIYHSVLPDSLTHLIFGNSFNQPINPGCLPSSLIHVEFGDEFNSKLKPGALPHNIVKLALGKSICHSLALVDTIPSSVVYIQLHSTASFACLPRTITHLTLLCDGEVSKSPGMIPDHITHLTLSGSFRGQHFPSNIIPDSITHLRLTTLWELAVVARIAPSTSYQLVLPGAYIGIVDTSQFHVPVEYEFQKLTEKPIWYDPNDKRSYSFSCSSAHR